MKTTARKLIGLEEVAGLPVEEGDYGGDAREYIVFDYADERGGLFGDDEALTVTDYMQVRVTLDHETDYYGMKEAIWAYLETEGFDDISFESYSQREDDGVARYLIFECSYTGLKGE